MKLILISSSRVSLRVNLRLLEQLFTGIRRKELSGSEVSKSSSRFVSSDNISELSRKNSLRLSRFWDLGFLRRLARLEQNELFCDGRFRLYRRESCSRTRRPRPSGESPAAERERLARARGGKI